MKPRWTTILRFKTERRRLFICAPLALILLTVFAGAYKSAVASEPGETNDKNNANSPVRITADKLTAQVNAGEIEYIGNVKATQADAVITSDRLKIVYNPDSVKNMAGDSKNVSIEKIIANGNVKIEIDNIIAETDRAEYTIKSKVLVLLGRQSKVSQGGHSITGTKFTLHRREGKLTVEGRGDDRIRAILKPGAGDK